MAHKDEPWWWLWPRVLKGKTSYHPRPNPGSFEAGVVGPIPRADLDKALEEENERAAQKFAEEREKIQLEPTMEEDDNLHKKLFGPRKSGDGSSDSQPTD